MYRSLLLALIIAGSLSLGGCSTAPIKDGEPIEPVFAADRILHDEDDVETAGEEISDPWEGFNRAMYRFNYRFDKYLFLPAVNAYQTVTPDFVETGIHNFLTNFGNINTLLNSILQLSAEKTVETTGRIIVNTTMGLLGFLDVATHMEIPQHKEDFGQSMGYWGVGTGPYLVLPVLGPSNVRDGVGLVVDFYVTNEVRDAIFNLETWQEWTWSIIAAIDLRANTAFRYYETGSPFEYEWVRLLFNTMRELEIQK